MYTMIEKLRESSGNVIGYKAVGTITKEDVEKVKPDLQYLAQNEGKFCMLFDLDQFQGETVEALTEDLEFGLEYGNDIQKIAIVGDKEWEEKVTNTANTLGMNAKYFHTSEIEQAWRWLRE